MTQTTDKTEPEATPAPSPAPTGLNDPRTVRILQFAVIAMGAILVIGLITVMSRILYLYLGSGNPNPITTHSATPGATLPLALPQGASVTSMSLSGDRLAVYFQAPSGNGIAILNVKTGAVESTINLVPDVPAN